jgi:hypothetical protein
MTQTLKSLINSVAAEVYELQDTKADRIDLNGCIQSVQNDPNDPTSQVSLSKVGTVLKLNTTNLKATLQQTDRLTDRQSLRAWDVPLAVLLITVIRRRTVTPCQAIQQF